MSMNHLDILQNWYFSQCDGDWEHQYGVKIDTLDNPGWSIDIDLKNLNCKLTPFDDIDKQRNTNDWYQCFVRNNRFMGRCGPKNLTEVIEVFFKWSGIG